MLKIRLDHANASSHWVQRSLMWLLALAPLEILVGLLYATGAPSALRPLVAASDWNVSGQFERFDVDAVSPIELPEDALQSPDLVLWHARTPEAHANGGTVATRPFVPPSTSRCHTSDFRESIRTIAFSCNALGHTAKSLSRRSGRTHSGRLLS